MSTIIFETNFFLDLIASFLRESPNTFRDCNKGHFDFVKDFIYLFLERGEGSEEERERNINQLPLV